MGSPPGYAIAVNGSGACHKDKARLRFAKATENWDHVVRNTAIAILDDVRHGYPPSNRLRYDFPAASRASRSALSRSQLARNASSAFLRRFGIWRWEIGSARHESPTTDCESQRGNQIGS
jgi:hypothetical protein